MGQVISAVENLDLVRQRNSELPDEFHSPKPAENTLKKTIQDTEDGWVAGRITHSKLQRRMMIAWHMRDRKRLMEELMQISQEIFGQSNTPSYDPEHKRTETQAREEMLFVLCEVSDAYITNAIDGLIAATYYNIRGDVPPTVVRVGPTNNVRRPAIYLNVLCGNDGQSVSVSQLQTIINEIEAYHADLNWDPREQCWIRREQTYEEAQRFGQYDEYSYRNSSKTTKRYPKTSYIRQSQRRFCSTTQARRDQSREQAKRWSKALDEIKANVLQNGSPALGPDSLLPWSWFAECGYTHDLESRIHEHASGSSSVDLMNLVDGICQTKFSRDGLRFRGFFVGNVRKSSLVSMSEHVHSLLNYTYRSQGGFNVSVAGISTGSKHDILTKTYDALQTEVEANNRLQRNVERCGRDAQTLQDQQHLVVEYRKLLYKHEKLLEGLQTARLRATEFEPRLHAELDRLAPKIMACMDGLTGKLNAVQQMQEDAKNIQMMEEYWRIVQRAQQDTGLVLEDLMEK